MEKSCDVAIIGGGPAGSTAATLLARNRRSVVVLEKEKFPRFHIGESLLPYSMAAFERLGVRQKLDERFLTKHGGEIITASGSNGQKFYFRNGFRLREHTSYQVTRSEFDQLLLDHAAESGAEIRQETEVTHLAFDGEGVSLAVRGAGDSCTRIRASYLIDCSGRNSVAGNHFKLKKSYPHLRKFAIYAHYENVDREPGIDGTLTRMVRARDRWFWMIPLSPSRMSIGLVMDTDDFKKLKKSPEELLEADLRGHPAIRERMTRAVRASEVYSASDYSYRNTRLAGDRWLLAGDAAGFIDPVFSTGVFLAVMSGEDAADAVEASLMRPANGKRRFRKYERKINRVMDMYLRFVNAWYRDEFIELFSSPFEHVQMIPAMNSVLAGNIAGSFGVRWRLELFYVFLFLQRYIPLVPRISPAPAVKIL
jgi:FADH2-dependent halogenase